MSFVDRLQTESATPNGRVLRLGFAQDSITASGLFCCGVEAQCRNHNDSSAGGRLIEKKQPYNRVAHRNSPNNTGMRQ